MEKKRFKLVYEDTDGYIKGSYSGIPSKDDVVLIKRAVLEGTEEGGDPTYWEELDKLTPEEQEQLVNEELF